MRTLEINVSAVPEQHRDWVAGVVEKVESQLRDGDEVMPMGVIHSATENSLNFVGTSFSSEQEKNAFAHFMRFTCKKLDADAVLFVSEAWALKPSKMADYHAIIEQYGSIGESPHRIDNVIFVLETASLNYMCTAPILPCPPSKKRRRLESPAKFMVANAGGRFSQMLSDTVSKQSKH